MKLILTAMLLLLGPELCKAQMPAVSVDSSGNLIYGHSNEGWTPLPPDTTSSVLRLVEGDNGWEIDPSGMGLNDNGLWCDTNAIKQELSALKTWGIHANYEGQMYRRLNVLREANIEAHRTKPDARISAMLRELDIHRAHGGKLLRADDRFVTISDFFDILEYYVYHTN